MYIYIYIYILVGQPDRETGRQAGRQRVRETERQTDRERQTERGRARQRERERGRESTTPYLNCPLTSSPSSPSSPSSSSSSSSRLRVFFYCQVPRPAAVVCGGPSRGGEEGLHWEVRGTGEGLPGRDRGEVPGENLCHC